MRNALSLSVQKRIPQAADPTDVSIFLLKYALNSSPKRSLGTQTHTVPPFHGSLRNQLEIAHTTLLKADYY